MLTTLAGISALTLLLACGTPKVKPAETEVAPAQPTDLQAVTEPVQAAPVPQEPERFGDVVFDHRFHDFGEILTSDGPQSCTFVVTNLGEKPIAIYEVSPSCGCTNVTWTQQPIKLGESGEIHATYENADGPYAFDKTLTVYVSGISKPVVLHLKGVVKEDLSVENEII